MEDRLQGGLLFYSMRFHEIQKHPEINRDVFVGRPSPKPMESVARGDEAMGEA